MRPLFSNQAERVQAQLILAGALVVADVMARGLVVGPTTNVFDQAWRMAGEMVARAEQLVPQVAD